MTLELSISLVFTIVLENKKHILLNVCSEFCKMAKKLFICSSDEVKKMSSKSLLDDEGTIVNLESNQRTVIV